MELDYDFLATTFLLVLTAVPVTLKLTAVSLLFSAPFAFGIALLRRQAPGLLPRLAAAYVTFMRGTPMVLQILMIYSLLPSLLNALSQTLQLELDVFSLDPIWYAYAVFTLNTTALFSEVLRSGLGSVADGQLEAALCAGLTKPQAYVHIILPQAMTALRPCRR